MWGAADIANIWIYAAGILRLTLHHLNAHEIIIALRQMRNLAINLRRMVVGQMLQLQGMINDPIYNMRFDLTVFYQTMQECLPARISIARENFIT